MPLDIPTNRKEVIDRSKTDVKNELPGSNPFLQNSFVGSIITAAAGRNFDFYIFFSQSVDNLFPDTATGDFAQRWGNYVGVNLLPATQSSGLITMRASSTTNVPIGTVLQSSSGLTFTTQSAVTVQNTIYSLSSLTRVGSTVTATTTTDHNLASGVIVTIAGAVETEYNVSAPIIVNSSTEFTYEIDTTPTSPATGTITASSIIGSVNVVSDGFGAANNISTGDSLSLVTGIAGIIDPAFVQIGGLTGGADIESDEDYRERYLFRWQNPTPCFNVKDIEQTAKLVDGVTRVYVQPITPAVGQVSIYFLRDNDPGGPIPTPGQVTDVKNKLLTIVNATTNPDDVIVSAPTPVIVNFAFTAITPNTTAMKEAVTANLQQFFREGTAVGEDVLEDAYKCAIFQTVDISGNRIESFTLSSPIGNIAVGSNEVAILGTVTYP